MVVEKIEIEEMLAQVREAVKQDKSHCPDLDIAQKFLGKVKEYDLRLVKKDKRVSESILAVNKALDLYGTAFKSYTLLNELPTREDVKNRHQYIEDLQWKFAVAHHIYACSKKDREGLTATILNFKEIFETQDGLDKLDKHEREVGPIEWEKAFAHERYTPTLIGRFWDDII